MIRIAVGIAAAALLLPFSAGAERTRLAVLGLAAQGVDEDAGATLTSLLGTELTRLDRFEVLSVEDVKSLVAATQLAQVLGCEGPSCSADLGALGSRLNAGRLVTGTVGLVGEKALLNLTLLDPAAGKVVNRASAEAASLESLPGEMRAAVLALFGIAGQLVLWNQVDGAQVFVDERLVGVSPVPKLDLPREGTYTVRVYRDDSTPFEKTVDVRAGEVVRVKVDSVTFAELDARAASRRRWGRGLLAGGAFALVAGGVLYGLAVRSDARLDELDLRRPDDVAAGREITSTTFAFTAGAGAAGIVGAGLAGTGGWLLASNPWQDQLDRFALLPVEGGAQLVLAGRF